MEQSEQSYKILVVLPLYGGSLPIGEYCIHALKELGHKVEVFEASQFHSSFVALQGLHVTADKNDFLQNSFANLMAEAVYAKAETFAPDLVLALAQAPMNRAVLKRLQKDNIPTAMWFVEDYKLFTYWRAYAKLYTHFFVIQKEPFLSLLSGENGHESAHYLPLGALPSFHKQLDLSVQDYTKYCADVAFLGAGYANRRYEFRRLLSYNFKIWGSDWENDTILAPYLQNKGARVDPQTSVKVYNATKININLHSSIHTKNSEQGDFVNPRTFELASMGAFQLVDTRSLMPELFNTEEGFDRELVTFENFAEVPEIIDYYLAHEQERQEIAQRARARVLKEHTYAHRMKTMLEIINPPIRKEIYDETALEILPDDLKEEFVALTKKLDISPTVGFDELIYQLRKQTHVLNPLETSLLFLSEWQKQYGRK